MAIKIGGIDNPTEVKFVNNGTTTNLTEVWYKSSPSAVPVFVWPDKEIPKGNVTFTLKYNGFQGQCTSYQLRIYANKYSSQYTQYTAIPEGSYYPESHTIEISNHSKLVLLYFYLLLIQKCLVMLLD